MRAEVFAVVLCLSSASFAQARRGGTPELEVPQFSFPHDGATEIGTSVQAEGTAHPLVEVVLFDGDGNELTRVESSEEGHWSARVPTPLGPTHLSARVVFVGEWSKPSEVHFTMLLDDALEGGGCSTGGAGTLLLALALWLRRGLSARA